MYKLTYIPGAKEDLFALPENILLEVLQYLEKFKTEPLKNSSRLNNQGGLNLDGYRKTYVAKATYRIIFKLEDGVAKIVEVVAVGKRDNKEVYITAHERINKQ